MKTSTRVQLSRALVKTARSAAILSGRTIEGQIEYWMQLGKVLDSVISEASRAKIARRVDSDELAALIAFSQTPAGRRKARRAIVQAK